MAKKSGKESTNQRIEVPLQICLEINVLEGKEALGKLIKEKTTKICLKTEKNL
jgi:hypothetical protein